MTRSKSQQRLNELLPLVYEELRVFASRALDREAANISVQTTDLVHEVYLRLSQLREIGWENEQEMLRTAGRGDASRIGRSRAAPTSAETETTGVSRAA